MQANWHLYRFDYAKYQTLRPLLRAATMPDAFAALSEGPQGDAIAEAVAEGTLTLECARNVLVSTLCCLDDPLPVDASFPRFLAVLGRRRGAEDAAEMLGALVSGERPVEDWLRDPQGLIGWLTPEETQALYSSYTSLLGANGRNRRSLGSIGRIPKRPVRRGGLLGALMCFVRNLFDAGPPPDDLVFLLGRQLQEAKVQNQGLAVCRA